MRDVKLIAQQIHTCGVCLLEYMNEYGLAAVQAYRHATQHTHNIGYVDHQLDRKADNVWY